jgi:hypothetical protein
MLKIWKILTFVLFVFLLFSIFIMRREIRVRQDLNKKLDALESNFCKKGKEEKPANPIALYGWHIERMQEKGLANPVQDIINDLKKHKELIPYKGSLGGTMNFYSDNKIWILTNHWVLAYFEDGHNGGYILLEYQVKKGGKITWKRIDARLS